jgi:tetratricopeptide (TPR) repeat protein
MNDTGSTVNKSLQQITQLQQRAIQFAESGMVEEALEAAMICIGLQEEVAPNDLLLRAKLTQNASRILLYAGELDYSEKIAREGLDLLQTAEGVTNDDRAHAFLNMSSILYTKKELDSAALILQDALAIWSKEAGRDAEVAECYNNLG